MNYKLLKKFLTNDKPNDLIKAKSNKTDGYYMDAVILNIDEEEVLGVYMYDNDSDNAKVVSFITRNDFFNYVNGKRDNKKFITCTAKKRYSDTRYISKRADKYISSYTENSAKELCSYSKLQKYNEVQLELKRKKRDSIINEQIVVVREELENLLLPKEFFSWVGDTVLADNRYIFYDNKEIQGYGQCSHCNNMGTINDYKHNATGKCSHCGSKITYICKGRFSKRYVTETVAIMQSLEDGFTIRYIDILLSIEKDTYTKEVNVNTSYMEVEYLIYRNDEPAYTKYKKDSSRDVGWIISISAVNMRGFGYDYCSHPTLVYPNNVKEVLENTRYRYSAYVLYFNEVRNSHLPSIYFSLYEMDNRVEMLVKMGYFNLLSIAYSNLYNKRNEIFDNTIDKLMQLTKKQKNEIKGIDITLYELNTVFEASKHNLFLTKDDVVKYAQFKNLDKALNYIDEIPFLSIEKLYNFIVKVSKSSTNGFSNIYQDWNDYMGWLKDLNYTLDSYHVHPKNFYENHDKLSKEHSKLMKKKKKKLILKYKQEIKKMYEELNKKYSFEDDDIVIVVPQNAMEIKKEGTALGHCVGGFAYLEKMATGESIILFVRNKKNPEKSLCTMEVSAKTHEVIQCRAKKNVAPCEHIMRHIDKYKEKVLLVA